MLQMKKDIHRKSKQFASQCTARKLWRLDPCTGMRGPRIHVLTPAVSGVLAILRIPVTAHLH